MSKDYASINIEFRAKELLSSMKASCPDMVWNELNAELDVKRANASKGWFDKLNTSRMAIIIPSIVLLGVLVCWRFVFSKGNSASGQVVYQAPIKKVVQQPQPAPVKQTSVAIQPKKDSVTPAPTTNIVAVNNTTKPVTQNNPQQLAVNTPKQAPVQQKQAVKNNPTTPSEPSSTQGNNLSNGTASLTSDPPSDTTFTMHRTGMVPTTNVGHEVQDTAFNK